MAARSDDQVRVVMLPWLALGHMIPFLDLSIALAKSRIHVYFLSTPRNILRLPKIPPNLSPFIDFVPFSLPKLENSNLLPEYAEASIDFPADKIQYLKKAYDLLQDPIKNFVAERLPHWIIIDFVSHWAVDIAQEFNIPLIRYYIVSATAAVFFGSPESLVGDRKRTSPESWTAPPEWVDFPSKVAYKKHEAIPVHAEFTGETPPGNYQVPAWRKFSKRAKLLQYAPALNLKAIT